MAKFFEPEHSLQLAVTRQTQPSASRIGNAIAKPSSVHDDRRTYAAKQPRLLSLRAAAPLRHERRTKRRFPYLTRAVGRRDLLLERSRIVRLPQIAPPKLP
ncbi:hypothetical protein D3C84_781360 [compost metagenome]